MRCLTLYLILFIFQNFYNKLCVDASLRFTNIACKTFDKPFADFERCQLKVLQRGVIGLNLHVKLFQVNVKNISVNLSLWKKASGFRPFLYNITTNFCGFMKHRSRQPFLKIFFDLLLKASNINHTCPYNHDIIVNNLVLSDDMLALMPLPSGDYMFKLMVGAYNDWKADVRAYVSRFEK